KYDVPLYPFFMEGIATQASLLQADGMHPTTQGVAVMVKGFLPIMQKTIKQPTVTSDTSDTEQ
ncbi:hypothetical protein K4H00_27325, partial [Mycobacterium tuberculosis]|nr:hypothetical protein [Mycobacterium tuberculosis]